MPKPPICLDLNSFVIMYGKVDSTVKFMDRKNLNVDGEWLGRVPNLAICKNIESNDYCLAHCDKDWNALCSVEIRGSIDEVKGVAEKHYNGINSKWIETCFQESSARKIINEEIEKSRCSFCGESPYDIHESLQMFVGKKAQICSNCMDMIQNEFRN